MSCCNNEETYDIAVYTGADYQQELVYSDPDDVPINLTGYTAQMQVRPSVAAADVIADLTTENGGITIAGVLGKITLALTNTQTAALTPGQYVYDIKLISGSGFESILLSGNFIVVEAVTR